MIFSQISGAFSDQCRDAARTHPIHDGAGKSHGSGGFRAFIMGGSMVALLVVADTLSGEQLPYDKKPTQARSFRVPAP